METSGGGLPAAPADLSGGVPARIPDPDPDDQPGKVKRAWRWWLGKAAIIGANRLLQSTQIAGYPPTRACRTA